MSQEETSLELGALPWVIVGAGRVGCALGVLARDLGLEVRAFYNRTRPRAERAARWMPPGARALWGDLEVLGPALEGGPALVWVTVVDDALEEVAATIAPWVDPGGITLHTAGSLGARVLRRAGVPTPCGSLHPLQAMADPAQARAAMARCVWTLEGDAPAEAWARALMGRIGVEPVAVRPQGKALYHASAVTAANLLVGLLDAAYEMAGLASIPRAQARQMLLPLARSCLENLERRDPADALTGPAARGDTSTLARHLEALADHPELRQLYEVLTARAQAIAARARDGQDEE